MREGVGDAREGLSGRVRNGGLLHSNCNWFRDDNVDCVFGCCASRGGFDTFRPGLRFVLSRLQFCFQACNGLFERCLLLRSNAGELVSAGAKFALELLDLRVRRGLSGLATSTAPGLS